VEGAERAANQVVFEDRPVSVRYGTADQLSQLRVRKEVARAGLLRAIEIEAVDLQPCGGTHVRSTGQIGMVLVRRSTKVRQDWRVEFICGGRAERAARRDFLLLRRAAEKLSSAPEEVASAASRALTERDLNFKNYRAMLERLAQSEAKVALEAAPASLNGLRVVSSIVKDLPAEYLGYFATELSKSEKTIALLAVADGGQVVFAQHPSAGKDMNALLQQILEKVGGKGGGTRDFARGLLSDASKDNTAIALAKELLSVG
jgi:alanyl-tRNA synthetase